MNDNLDFFNVKICKIGVVNCINTFSDGNDGSINLDQTGDFYFTIDATGLVSYTITLDVIQPNDTSDNNTSTPENSELNELPDNPSNNQSDNQDSTTSTTTTTASTTKSQIRQIISNTETGKNTNFEILGLLVLIPVTTIKIYKRKHK